MPPIRVSACRRSACPHAGDIRIRVGARSASVDLDDRGREPRGVRRVAYPSRAPLTHDKRIDIVAAMNLERPSEPLQVALSGGFYAVALFGALFTFGMALPVVWWISLRYPLLVDVDGITTRGGTHHPWDSLERTLRLSHGGFRLVFRDGDVNVALGMLAQPIFLLEQLQRFGVGTGVNMTITRGRGVVR